MVKLTFGEEPPPKPPRLFLTADSKEVAPSPADSPVRIWVHREIFVFWSGFFSGLGPALSSQMQVLFDL